MTRAEYYIAPSQEIFEDIKASAIRLWQTYDDTYGYASSKVNRIKDIQNIRDNAGYIVAMFDWNNQNRLLDMVSPETHVWLRELLDFGRDTA